MAMKLTFNELIFFIFFTVFSGCEHQHKDKIQSLIIHSESQLDYALQNINSTRTENLVSPRTAENGTLKLVPASDWTSGFFPGNLWMIYELSGNEKWKEIALQFTLPLEAEKWNGKTHDMGFKMFCSFGKALKYDDNPEYREILIQSAKTLSTRFNPVVGCLRSWDSNPKTSQWKFPVIIDNMMNLELLLWAAKETGNENFKKIAIKHAQTTIKNHFRDDFSSYHVVDYNPETGEPVQKGTHQGLADESSWARGQAWALYGFTMMYRETGMEEFLDQAHNIANYIINQEGIKDGKIPHWDFNAPDNSNEPYDASAGAIISAALLDLAEFSDNNGVYLEVAQKLMATLSSDEFLAPIGENDGFLLKHSTGSLPFHSEIDVPLVYADYYFLESLVKTINMKKT
jgi:hypothetical protein